MPRWSVRKGFVAGLLGSNPVQYEMMEQTAEINARLAQSPSPQSLDAETHASLQYAGFMAVLLQPVWDALQRDLAPATMSGSCAVWARTHRERLARTHATLADSVPPAHWALVRLDLMSALASYVAAADHWLAGDQAAGDAAAAEAASEWDDAVELMELTGL